VSGSQACRQYRQDCEVSGARDHAHLFPGCYRDSRLVGRSSHRIGHWCRRSGVTSPISLRTAEKLRSCFRGCPWLCKGETRSHS